MGGSSQTKTSTYKPDDQAYSAYSDILRRAQTLGQQPYTPYGGQLTAGWTPGQQSALDQTAGITGYGKDLLERAQGISEWAGRLGTTYQPYFDAATSMVNRGAGDVVAPMVGRVDTVSSRDVSPTAFSAAGLEKYLSPYTQNVIDSTMANIRQNDAVQQRNVVSDAIRQGNAFGGDRMGVAQAELARNQNLASGQTMANLSNAGYAQAMQAWQNEMASKLSADTGNADRSLTAARDTAGRQLQASISDADRAFAASRDNAGRSLQAAGLMGNLGSAAQSNIMNALGVQNTALGQANQAQATRMAGAGQQGQLSSMEQALQQGGLDRLYEQWQQAQRFPYEQLQWQSGITSGIGSLMGGTGTEQTETSGGIGQILGGLIALGSKIPSDERVKEDIREVGRTYDGQPVYSYRYKDGGPTQMGLMAQDVLEYKPDAVGEVGGILGVDYKKALEDAIPQRAAGGVVPYGAVQRGAGIIPAVDLRPGNTMPKPSGGGGGAPQTNIASLAGQVGDFARGIGNAFSSPTQLSGAAAPTAAGAMMPDAGMGGGVIGALGLYNRGGIVPHRAAGGGIFGDLFGPDAEREAIMIARDPESSGLGAGIPYGAPDAPSPVPTGGLGPLVAGELGGLPYAPQEASAPAGYLSALRTQESGGNDLARAPTSSATGRYQFLNSTWSNLVNSPEGQAAGLTMGGRTDPAQQERAIQIFTNQNAAALRNAGHEATPGNLYMAHFLGSGGGSRMLSALRDDPSAPATSYADPAAVRANQSVFFNRDGSPRTVAQMVAHQTRRFGGADAIEAAAPREGGDMPAGASAYAATEGGIAPAVSPSAEKPAQGGIGGIGDYVSRLFTGRLDDRESRALMTMGLAMMAAQGNLGQQIGQGGLAALAAMQSGDRAERERAKEALELEALRARTGSTTAQTDLHRAQLRQVEEDMRRRERDRQRIDAARRAGVASATTPAGQVAPPATIIPAPDAAPAPQASSTTPDAPPVAPSPPSADGPAAEKPTTATTVDGPARSANAPVPAEMTQRMRRIAEIDRLLPQIESDDIRKALQDERRALAPDIQTQARPDGSIVWWEKSNPTRVFDLAPAPSETGITRETREREAVARARGENLEDPAVRNWILTGRREIPADTAVPKIVTIKNPATGEDESVEQLPDGTLRRPTIQGERPANGNPYATGRFNETQGKAAGFADRMFQAEQVLRETEAASLDRLQRAARGVPLVGNSLVSSDFQKAEQGRRNFINAILRRESGAAISPSESENADRQYFPQPGDGPDVLAQKRRNRQDAISALSREAGPSYRPPFTFNERGDLVRRAQNEEGASGAGPRRVSSTAERDALPSGTQYMAPDGSIRTKR